MSQTKVDRTLPWIVLSVFVLLTCAATTYVWRTSRAADRARFDNGVQAARDAINARLDTYVDVLTATASLVAVDPDLPLRDLGEYIRNLDVQRRYPGIQGIGLSRRLLPHEIADVTLEMRNAGFPQFRVWPETPRAEYHAIVLLEPLDRRNAAALGFDMYTHPRRQAAMARARDTGLPAASAVVTLVQEIETRKQHGFLIYVPVYRTVSTPATIAERNTQLFGFVYAPFRLDDLFQGIFGTQERPEAGFEIYVNGALVQRTEELVANPRFTAKETIDVAGQKWVIRYLSQRTGSGNALLFSGGTLIGGLAIAILLSMLIRVQLRAREQAEETAAQLLSSQSELERANRAKDDFLATLSHELRTPMTSILGWAQMLTESGLDRDTVQLAIDAISKSSRVQAQLIDDLLDVSRITAGKMRIDPQPTELGPVLSSAVETVRATADAKGVALTLELEPSVCVSGEERRLQQIVWNLVTNAVKFTPAGGSVTVKLRSDARNAYVEVRDTGHGIDPEFMPHLFERFRQADSSMTRAHMGLGLGLAIVHHLVELHAGTIEAISEGLGKGATFVVTLPLAREAAGSRREERRANDAEALRGARVLVVDDDEEVRSYVGIVFRGSGADVRAAASASEALGILDGWPADVVVTDLGMPEMDGYELARRIRETKSTPIVALTAFAMPEDRQRVAEAGMDGFVAKPVEPRRLRGEVAAVLRRRQEASAVGP